MRRHIGWVLCLLLLLPSGTKAQKPLGESQPQRIGITSQQQKQLEALFAESKRQRQAIRSRQHALYRELRSLYDSYDFDPQRARAIREEIVAQHRRLLDLYAENETKLRRILNREQFERLRAQLKAARAERERHPHDRHRPEWRGWHGGQ
ncbi:MAG TPA: periplasmic heavy metal sensor [Chthonomonadaceae bacterium]|nr:periplasmic heavy metal sensor [Chthonomonadaceae bacterium]